MGELNLYLVAPVGYESMSSVVVAPTMDLAKERVNNHPSIKELTDMGVELIALDVTKALALQGYNVLVSKVGIYH